MRNPWCLLELLQTHIHLSLSLSRSLSLSLSLSHATEMVLKVRVYGLWGTGGYMRNPWCLLELFIVLAGFTDEILQLLTVTDGAGAQATRACRSLFILRLAKGLCLVPSMATLLSSYLLCAKRSVAVLVCTLIFNFCFAAIGLTLFGGHGQFRYL